VLDLTGQRFGRLVAVEMVDRHRGAKWLCKCDCGRLHKAAAKYLRNGSLVSCGCIQEWSRGKHGMGHTRAYQTWKLMHARCRTKREKTYRRYGARGISVCERWGTFDNFLEDMGHAPDGMSIERVDNDKGYSPENCVWATSKQQNRNRDSNALVTLNGETRCVAEWCEVLDLPANMVHQRIYRGWPPERALTTPKQKYTGPRRKPKECREEREQTRLESLDRRRRWMARLRPAVRERIETEGHWRSKRRK
jgi:hypothetical protein